MRSSDWSSDVCSSDLNAESRLCLREGCGKAPAVIFRKIEIIHGAGDVEIAVCIEAIDEADPLMPQIAFHLKICVEAEAFRIARLQPTPELLRQARFGQIRAVRGNTGHAQTSGGRVRSDERRGGEGWGRTCRLRR